MINMNGVELQSMTYNGVEVQTWTHDGVEVYSAFTPFYVVNEGVLVEGNYTSANRIVENLHTVTDLNYGASGHSAVAEAEHKAGASVTFNTNGATTLTIIGEGIATAGDATKIVITSGTTTILSEIKVDNLNKTVDVSNYDTVTVQYFAYENNSDKSSLRAKITSIYCYK